MESPLDYIREVLGGPPAPEAPLADRSEGRRFVRDVIVWMRGPGGLRTATLPEFELERDRDAAWLEGHLLQSSTWANVAYAGLLAGSATALAAMVADRVDGASSTVLVTALLAAVTVLALVASAALWWRARVEVSVAIVDQEAPLGPQQLAALWRAGRRAERSFQRWVVARHGFTHTAVSLAKVNGVRCLIPGPAGFVTVGRSTEAPPPPFPRPRRPPMAA